jgi:hypothetical protein
MQAVRGIGCQLASLLGDIIDDPPKTLAEAAPGCIVGGGIVVNSLLFADDVALIAKAPADMQRLLDATAEHAAANEAPARSPLQALNL